MTTEDIGVIIGNSNAMEEITKMNFYHLYKIDIFPFYNTDVDQMKAIQQNSDIAVLTLKKPVPLNTEVIPICLPPLSDSSKTYEGVLGTVAGWGKTETGAPSVNQLLKVDVPIISNKECKKFYKWLKRYFFKCILLSLYFIH